MSKKKMLFLTFVLALLCGCGMLGEMINEGAQITPTEMGPSADAVSVLVNGLIPAPYKIPSALALGYIIALVRRMYKKKKGAIS